MSLPRLDHTTHIADRLNELAAVVKTRSRASLTDASHILENISVRFLNALFGWKLENLNAKLTNYPAADLGDSERRIAIQVTNQEGSTKITHTAAKAVEYTLGNDFDVLIIFFLLPKKPAFPKKFTQPPAGPKIETWDIADLLKQMQQMTDLKALAGAAKILYEEMGNIREPDEARKFDISRILKYAPAQLIGRNDELKLLNDAWSKVQSETKPRSHILTFVAFGGEGKTSLVGKWAAELAAHDWPGCEAGFAWSFYSQGTREQHAASSDLFLKEALNFFGDDADKAFAASPAGAFEKGQRLARIVGQRRSLLILDGLEPLQYAPTSPTPGELKDQGIAALLKGLATSSRGLCLVTTRYSLPDLRAYWQTTAPEQPLLCMSTPAGVELMLKLNVRGMRIEIERTVEDVKGHALTLFLLGTFLRDAFGGDIRKRDLVKLTEADAEEQGGHAFRVMAAYVKSLQSEGAKGQRALAMLRLLGLFDRPATASCLGALWKTPAIGGLTEPLLEMSEAQRNLVLKRLEDAKLLTVNREESGELISLDAHPLLREYFARQLHGEQPDSWQAAHRRVYEHLCANTPDKEEPTLEDLQPLYQAVAHGCQAGLQQAVCQNLYEKRIRRGEQAYSTKKLGAFGSDLGAMASFFDRVWSTPSFNLIEERRGWLLNQVGFSLRALGRIREALEALHLSVPIAVDQKDWKQAARRANNVSESELILGNINSAKSAAEQAVAFAELNRELFERMGFRTTQAECLHQAAKNAAAAELFQKAEDLQMERDPGHPLLYSIQGFRYCEFLMSDTECQSWRQFLGLEPRGNTQQNHSCVIQLRGRIEQMLSSVSSAGSRLLALGLAHLAFGRLTLYSGILDFEQGSDVGSHSGIAVESLRNAGQMQELPRGLLTRAWFRFLAGAKTGSESAQADLDEAWEIAERGPMRLHMADIHLYRARLFFRERPYPWNQNPDGTPRGPADDLAAAEKLINTCGYHRRDEELAEAKLAILGK